MYTVTKFLTKQEWDKEMETAWTTNHLITEGIRDLNGNMVTLYYIKTIKTKEETMTVKHFFITLAVVYLAMYVAYTIAGFNMLITNYTNRYMVIFFVGTCACGWLAAIVLLISNLKQKED